MLFNLETYVVIMVSKTQEGQAAELWPVPELSAWTPSNVKAKSGKKRIFISWDQPIVNGVLHPDVAGYRIFQSDDDVTYHPIGTVSRNFPRAFTFLIDMDVGTQYFKVATVFKHQYLSPLSSAVSIVHGEGYGD